MSRSTFDGEPPPIVMVSDIVQYFYCPRKVYYLKVLGAPFVAKLKMMRGSSEDEKEKRRLEERKSVYGFAPSEVFQIIHDLCLEDTKVGIAGQLDTLLELKDGEFVPVDSKFTEDVIVHRHYKKQLIAYSLLVDSSFDTIVTRGVIYFTKQKKPFVVPIASEDKIALLKDLDKIRSILSGETVPRKVSESKCGYCEVARYCI